MLNATIGGKPVVDDQLYTVATIDYLADGNGRMDAFLQAEKGNARKMLLYADCFWTMYGSKRRKAKSLRRSWTDV